VAVNARRAVAGAFAAALAAAAAAGADPRPKGPPGLPDPWIPGDNPGTFARVDLGRRLFSDPILSRDRTTSCATCHPPEKAYADGRPLAVGIRGQVQKRHAPTLLNAAYARRLFWDGRARSLEEQAGQPNVNPTEMDLTEAEAVARLASDPDYPARFERAFGSPGVDFERIRKAIAAFERTLLAGDAPFDRWWNGDATAMDEAAERGFRLFMGRARCSSCHPVRQSYALFTDEDFHNTGAGEGEGFDDPGLGARTGRAEDARKFRTPTLRNVALTAPYMHDGSQATLEDVVDFYDRGGVPNPGLDPDMRPLLLSRRDRADLVAFLKALTSPTLPGAGGGADLLARREFRAARERFLRDLAAAPGDPAALFGLAEAALGTGEEPHLADARERLRAAEAADHPAEARARAGIWGGRCDGALAAIAEAAADGTRAALHRHDAALSFARARTAAPFLDDAFLEGAAAEEARGAPVAAEAILDALVEKSGRADPDAFEARAALRYRRALAAARAAGNVLDAAARTSFEGAAADVAARAALAGSPVGFDPLLVRARSLHWLGRKEEAEAAYRAAIPVVPGSRPALTGLASLLSGRAEAWTAALEGLHRDHPGHAETLYFLAFDRFSRKDAAAAGAAFTALAALEPAAARGPLFLGRLARERGDGAAAFAHWLEALRREPGNAEAVNDADAALRDLALTGWDAVATLDARLRELVALCGEPYRRAVLRNNAAFRIREAVSTFTSRGRGRMQYLVPGAPPEALRWMRRCVEIYEEAVAEVPPEAAWTELSEDARWVYAGVLNDAGLMRHYFAEVQDLAAAEALYLRAFRITDGAYMDAYFYNLQFLYGFELPGRERRWLRLAARAKEAILKETPEGRVPDERKRAAAERDYERLRDLLGEKEADAAEREEE
jgi:cytochrome c peroxidase